MLGLNHASEVGAGRNLLTFLNGDLLQHARGSRQDTKVVDLFVLQGQQRFQLRDARLLGRDLRLRRARDDVQALLFNVVSVGEVLRANLRKL